jgi:hypothetical protein
MQPETLAILEDRQRFAVLADGTLQGFHVSCAPGLQAVYQSDSVDSGRTWSTPRSILPLPAAIALEQVAPPPRCASLPAPAGSAAAGSADDSSDADPMGRWGGCQVLVDADQEVHLFLVNDRGTGMLLPQEERGKAPSLAAHERRLDVWHARSRNGRTLWSAPKRIWKGYTGSINAAICTASGRLVLPFAMLTHRTWRDRGPEPGSFTFPGLSTTIVLYSDDGGTTWQQSAAELTVATPCIGTYGAVEPVVVERGDGELWMLIRTQQGRFYESFSTDGADWTAALPSTIVSSDSPAGLVRLPDGRLCLLWNKCRRFPYAHGGRHVLHAGISADHGKTWTGQREVACDPLRHQPPPPGGDHGTAYPFPVVLADGRVLAATGQGKGRIQLVAIDPSWLEERQQQADFADALGAWHTFGCRGAEMAPAAGPHGAPGLCLRRAEASWESAAVWNIPAAGAGRIQLRLFLAAGSGPMALMLTDHFSVPFDLEDALHAVYVLGIGAAGELSCGAALPIGRWVDLSLDWDCPGLAAQVSVDGQDAGTLVAARRAGGISYLRLRALDRAPHAGGLTVGAACAHVTEWPGPE